MNLELPKNKLSEKGQRQTFIGYWFERIFLDDWLLKVAALFITLALWLGVAGTRTPITRPINNLSLSTLVSKNLEVTNSFVPEVDIEITGDKQKVDKVIGRDLAVTVDLTGYQEGLQKVHLTPQSVSVELPSGVFVTKISPEIIAVKLERVEEKEIPVRVDTEGSPPSEYEVYKITVQPATVRVRGPKSFIEALRFVSTDHIDLTGKTKGWVENQLPLSISDPKITLVKDVTATVNVQIGPRRVERLMVVPYETQTRSGQATVRLFGPASILEDLVPEQIIVAESRTPDGRSTLEIVLPDKAKDNVTVRSVKYRE